MARQLDASFVQRMAHFPCVFNMKSSVNREKNHLEAKLETVLEEGDYEQDTRKLNYITWLQFTLETIRGENHDASLEYNGKARLLSDGNDIVFLANRAFLLKHLGDDANSETCLNELEKIRHSPQFEMLLADAKAQQAYSYARIGEAVNQDLAIGLYIQALAVKKDNRWSYGLGLACMRTIHSHMKTFKFQLNTQERVRRGAKALFEVARTDPDVLMRGQGFMNLALLQSYARRYAKNMFTEEDHRSIFENMSVENLIDQAVVLGPDDYKILADCGRALCEHNQVKAKQFFLRSNQIQPNSKAYHQLGFLEKDKSRRLYNWLIGLRLSHHSDLAIVKGVQTLLRQSSGDGLLKTCFLLHYPAAFRRIDVLVVAQDQNDQTQKVTTILTTCFGLGATTFNRQTNDLRSEVTKHEVVILVLPKVIESTFLELINALVAMMSQEGGTEKLKVLVTDSHVQVPVVVQELNRLPMRDIFESIGSAPINYQTLLGNNQQCISLLKLFTLITKQ